MSKEKKILLEEIKEKAAEKAVSSIWNNNIEVPMIGEEDAHSYRLTNPPHYAIMTYVLYNDTAVIGLFPNINPHDPEDKTSTIAVSPSNVSHEGLVAIFEALLEVKPNEVVDASIVHLSEEQLATVLACELDQDQVFSFIYAGEGERNKCFDMTTLVTVVKDIEDIPKEELDAILSQQRSLLSNITEPSS